MKRLLRSWLWRVPLEREVDEEIAFHLEMRVRELVRDGMDAKAAREIATSRIGDVNKLKRACTTIGRKRDREMRLTQWLEEFRDDVTFAIRQLKGSPSFTLVAAITLALGIGANSAMFALVDATLMRPLPYPEPDRLVMIWERTPARPRTAVGILNFRDWEERNRSFDAMATINIGLGGGPVLTAPDGTAESVERQYVSTRFFDVLGVQPIAGRTFLPADVGPSTTVVVLSEGVWRARLGGDPTLIGGDVRLNGVPHTVIGVVPDAVRFARPAGIWTLLPEIPASFNQRGLRGFEAIGRLKQGVMLEAAQADLSVIADGLAREYPSTNKDVGVTVGPLRTGLMGPELQLTSIFLLGFVGFVLLMCCANVAILMMARASVRARELAVRSVLGAGRARIVRQLLTESLVLAALGGALGVAVGAAILDAAPALIPAGLLPASVTLTFDGRVVAFCAAAALGVGVMFGLMPAYQATRTSLVQGISSDSRSTTRGGGRFRNLLAAGQVAAAVLLLCGAGLLLRTMAVLGAFDPGYRADGDSVLTLDFSVPNSRYKTTDALLQFYDIVERDLRALPEVRTLGWASTLPWGNSELGRWPFEIVGDAPVDPANRANAEYTLASPGYFQTLDLPITAGRAFTEHDTSKTTPVCIVNEAFVRRALQGRDPIGARVAIRPTFFASAPPVWEVVGVTRQVKGRPDEPEEMLQVYVPFAQHAYSDVFLVIQPTAGRPQALVPAIRATVARHDSNVPVRRIRTVDDLAGEATARYRFRAVMAATFAGLALLLAMVGVFGVLVYSVEQRRREFGLRMALGASGSSMLALVLKSAAWMLVVGTAVGLATAAALRRSVATFLFGVQPLDGVTFVAVPVMLALTALLAVAAPAWRASRVDPAIALRND